MPDGDDAAALDARRRAIRDAVDEAKTARLEKSVGFPSPGSSAGPGAEPLIGNGPSDGPLIKTDPAISPQAHAVGVNATRALGEIARDRPIGMVAKAGASAWEAAVTAEPGNRLRAALTHAGFDSAADCLKGAAGADDPDLTIDGAVDQAGDRLDGLIDRVRPTQPKPDDDGPLIR